MSGHNKATNPEGNVASRQTAGNEHTDGVSEDRTPEQERLLKKEDNQDHGSNEEPDARRTASYSGSKKENG